jgi:uncharacterized membrane protein YdbT with pleckstrin-like domain
MPATLDNPPPKPTRSSVLVRRAEGVREGEPVPPPMAAMLPAELLQPGEIIILLLKPSPWFIVLSPLKALVGIALATLALLVAYEAGIPLPKQLAQREAIVLLGASLLVLRLFWQFLEWLSRVYVLTDQRVIRVMGVLRVSVFETPLQQVQHTTLLFSIRERLFGLGTIGFATAGTGTYEAFWNMLNKPLEVHQKVVQTLRRYRR